MHLLNLLFVVGFSDNFSLIYVARKLKLFLGFMFAIYWLDLHKDIQ